METIITILSIGPPSLIFSNMVGVFFNQSLKFFILYILDVYKIRIGSNFIQKKLVKLVFFFLILIFICVYHINFPILQSLYLIHRDRCFSFNFKGFFFLITVN